MASQVWKTFHKKKDAEDFLDRVSPDVRDGSYREIQKSTFAQYADHWKKTHIIAETVKPSTLNSYLSIFDKHIKPEFEYMQMQAVSAAEINAFKAKLLKQKLSKKTVTNVLNLLNRFFRDAVKDHRVRHTPMEGVDKLEVSRKKKGRVLRPDEIQALLANAEDEDTRLITMTGVLTGIRRGEIFGLRWEDVDWDNDVIHVRQTLYWRFGKHVRPAEGDLFVFLPPKSEASIREIDLSPALKKELGQLRDQKSTVTVSASGSMTTIEPKGLIFCATDGRPLDPGNFQKKQFTDAVKAAGIGKGALP